MIFMGDTGSLSLGGALGAIAVAAKHEIVLAIIGGLFVLETAVGHHPGDVVQDDGQAGLRNGAVASPFRAEGLEGTDHRHPLLDHCHRAGADRPVDVEVEVVLLVFPARTFKANVSQSSAWRAPARPASRRFTWRCRGSCLGRFESGGREGQGARAADHKSARPRFLRTRRAGAQPGVPLTHPEPHWTVLKARHAGIEIIGDTEVFAARPMRQAPSSSGSPAPTASRRPRR
jgi:hypothetical protein